MTKRGSFKRAVRRQARESGKSYTQALTGMQSNEIRARMSVPWRADGLKDHLEQHYDIKITAITPIARHGGGVLRVDMPDGDSWVARIFPVRSVEAVRGDGEILQFLEQHDFPAERPAHAEPVTAFDGQGVLLTRFVEGRSSGTTVEDEFAFADMYGRLHALPPGTGGVARDGGAFGFDPLHYGKPIEDFAAAVGFLDAITGEVPSEHRGRYDFLRAESERVDGCEGLPEALTAPEMYATNVRVTPDGRWVAIDWKGAGRGARLAAFAALLEGGAGTKRQEAVMIDAITRGYSAHIRFEPEELDRLQGAMRLQPFYLGAHTFWSAILSGREMPPVTMPEAIKKRDDAIKDLASKARAALVEHAA